MKAILSMGLPGAGKSTVLKKRCNLDDFILIDPDEIKKEMPDYDPKDSGKYHAWSQEQTSIRIMEAVRLQKNIIIDGTGTNVEKMYSRVSMLQAAGYEVELLYVKVSLKTALKRNRQRERFVAEEIIQEKFLYIKDAFEILSNAADHSVIVNND